MRNLIGYGNNRPRFLWPEGKSVAVNFVINYEEGAELTPFNDDDYAETYGGEFQLQQGEKGQRNLSMESLFEFGARVGFWRLTSLFDRHNIPLTFFATGLALKLNPNVCQYLKQSQHEVAGHHWRWINYRTVAKTTEKEHIHLTYELIEKELNKKVEGWYSGRASTNTRELLREFKGIVYDSDSYADDLPYFDNDGKHLIVPYNLDCNDFRFTTNPGFSSSEDFFKHLTNALDYCCSQAGPEFLTIGLHPRISGRASRLGALARFIQHLQTKNNVWVAKRIDIAKAFKEKSKH